MDMTRTTKPDRPAPADDHKWEPRSCRVLLCGCPQRHPQFDLETVAAALRELGFGVHTQQRLCRLTAFAKVLDELSDATVDRPLDLVIGACNEALIGDLLLTGFSRLPVRPNCELIDLRAMPDLESFVGECLVRSRAFSDSAEQPCTWRSPARRFPFKRRSNDPRRALVVGGGVSGCQTALDLARSGIPVSLVESGLSLGGIMARLDKTFPTLDCSICILGPKLVQTANETAITLLPQSRVTRVSGRAGNFLVEILEQPRYVDMDKCSGCGTCMEVCPVIVPSAWNMGLKPGKAIGLVFEQAVPLRAAVQKDHCIDCGLCRQACERQAICLDQQPRTRHLRFGAIVLAHGAGIFDPARLGPYGYGRLPQVISNLEFERVVCATGPTRGELITPSGKIPRQVAFIQCAGSRNQRYLPYCSGFCCTASIKEAMLVLEHHPETEVTIFFNDIRTTGKNFESLYLRAQQRGIRFVKALASRIEPGTDDQVVIHYDPPGRTGPAQLAVDLAVLATGMEAAGGNIQWHLRSGPALDRYGFYQDKHPWSGPIESTADGIFLAGCCHGPRDITQTVTESSGAASRVIRFLSRGVPDEH